MVPAGGCCSVLNGVLWRGLRYAHEVVHQRSWACPGWKRDGGLVKAVLDTKGGVSRFVLADVEAGQLAGLRPFPRRGFASRLARVLRIGFVADGDGPRS